MTTDLSDVQDREYIFPYHYVAQFQGGFTHCVYDAWGINYAATLEYLLGRLKNEPFKSVVDIGCGDGRLISELAKPFPDAAATGLDYSKRAISLAKAMNPAGDYRVIDIQRQEVRERYDLALLIEVFEHISPSDSEAFLAAVARLLRPQGVLYITVPHTNKPVEYKHYRHFSVAQLKNCLEPHFRVEEVVPFEWRNWRMRVVNRLLCNRLYILNHRGLRQHLYEYFKKMAFAKRTEEDCQRIFVRAVKKSETGVARS